MAARYSKVERRIWRDEKFRKLSERGKTLWLYLLTNDAQDAFPGLYVLRMAVVADDLGWSPRIVQRELDDILKLGMARLDAATNVIWLPNAVRKRSDEIRGNEKNAKGWRTAWDQVPQSAVTREAFWAAVVALAEDFGGESSKVVQVFTAKTPTWVHPRINPRIAGQAAGPESWDELPADPRMDPRIDPEEKSIRREEKSESTSPRGAGGPSPSRWTERAILVGRTISAHADLFCSLTKQEIAPYVERIEKELAKVAFHNPGDVWPDLESEVDGWVSHARKKSEGRAWSPTQTLNEVESFARTRCRERKAVAESERARRRGSSAGEPGQMTEDAWAESLALPRVPS